jgi:hypothetical protein
MISPELVNTRKVIYTKTCHQAGWSGTRSSTIGLRLTLGVAGEGASAPNDVLKCLIRTEEGLLAHRGEAAIRLDSSKSNNNNS